MIVRTILICSFALLIGCSHGNVPASRDEVKLLDEEEQIAKSFELYPEFVKLAKSGKSIKLSEGHPHPMWEGDLLKKQKEAKTTVILRGFHFYAEPLTMSPQQANRLKELFVAIDNLQTFLGFKACGGFHPDFCAVFGEGANQVVVQFCFGCGEVKGFAGEMRLYCEMTERGDEIFESFLSAFHKYRPEPSKE